MALGKSGARQRRPALPVGHVAPPPDADALMPVRGSTFMRITTDRMPSAHRRRLRALRRNRWVGFRAALLLACGPRLAKNL